MHSEVELVNTYEAGDRMWNLCLVMIRFPSVNMRAEFHTSQTNVRVEIIIPLTQAKNLPKPMAINQEKEQ